MLELSGTIVLMNQSGASLTMPTCLLALLDCDAIDLPTSLLEKQLG